jgi:hypothetical protein
MNDLSAEAAMCLLTRRYTADPEALIAVLCPLLVPIHTLDKTIRILPGQTHARATFTVQLTEENYGVLVRGRTGKFVPAGYGSGEPGWREIAKGRITIVDSNAGTAEGEVYLGFGGDEASLAEAIAQLSADDFLEIDQYGVSAKALSGLTEYYLVRDLKTRGYRVLRMPEDMVPSACFCERGISLTSPSLVRCQRTSSSTACRSRSEPFMPHRRRNLVRHY